MRTSGVSGSDRSPLLLSAELTCAGSTTASESSLDEAGSCSPMMASSGSDDLCDERSACGSPVQAGMTYPRDTRFASCPESPGALSVEPVDSSRVARDAFFELMALTVSYTLAQTVLLAILSLQSSLSGTGLASLGAMHAAAALVALGTPSLIRSLGTRLCLAMCYVCVLVYLAVQLPFTSHLLLIGSLLLGCSLAPMWTCLGLRVTRSALRYSSVTCTSRPTALLQFDGVFLGVSQSAHVWAHLLSAVVTADPHTSNVNRGLASTRNTTACGAYHCQVHAHDGRVSGFLSLNARLILLGVCSVAIILATLLLAFIPASSSGGRAAISTSGKKPAFDRKLLLIVPLVLYTGLEQGFIIGDFTKSYISCALGMHKVGVVLSAFGVTSAVAGVVSGLVARRLERLPVMTSGAVFQVGLFIVLLRWRPSSDDVSMFYLSAAILGVCDAIWNTQVMALLGESPSVSHESVFSGCRLLQSLGAAAFYWLSLVLCVSSKVLMLASFLSFALVCSFFLEFIIRIENKDQRQQTVYL